MQSFLPTPLARLMNVLLITSSVLFGLIALYGAYLLVTDPVARAEAFAKPSLLFGLAFCAVIAIASFWTSVKYYPFSRVPSEDLSKRPRRKL